MSASIAKTTQLTMTRERVRELQENKQCIRIDLSNGMSVIVAGVGVEYGGFTKLGGRPAGEEFPIIIGSYCLNSCTFVIDPAEITSMETCDMQQADDIGHKMLDLKRIKDQCGPDGHVWKAKS